MLKRLPEVAQRLAGAGHKVSLLTNLSAPLRVISTFIEAAGEQLRTFSCSLHREEVEEAEFFEKARRREGAAGEVASRHLRGEQRGGARPGLRRGR